MKRVRFGTIHADVVGFDEAIDAIVRMVRGRDGGYVVTPNVDHVVLAETNQALRDAYADAALSLADGMPLVWMARAMGHPLPEKVSGSDLLDPLLARASREKLRVYFLGGAPGVAAAAAKKLRQAHTGFVVAGTDAPPMGFEKNEAVLWQVLERIRETKPDLVLVALGCPKQELLMHAYKRILAPAVLLGIGASLDFVVGTQKRSPRWMSRVGLEWAHRLISDPKRMAHRYLVRDRAIGAIFLRMMRTPFAERAYDVRG